MSVRLVRGLFPLRPVFDFGAVGGLLRSTAAYAVAIAMNSVYFRITVVIMSLIAPAVADRLFRRLVSSRGSARSSSLLW